MATKYFASLASGKGSLEGLVKLTGNHAVEVSAETARVLQSVYHDIVRITETVVADVEDKVKGK